MSVEISMLLILLPLTLLLCGSCSSQYRRVGDSLWSIPPTTHFYTNWSSSHSFHAGETLYFDFDSGLYNLMQVSRGEFDRCTANMPYKSFVDGPALVHLTEKGVFYFVCSVANYCTLGLKLSVIVEENVRDPSPSPTPT